MKVLAIVGGIFFCILVLLAAPMLVLIPGLLIFGWIPASIRLFGNMPFSGSDLALFAGGCVLFALGAHWFLGRVGTWRVRWTGALVGVCAFVLLAIMSMVGVAHQIGWMLLSPEPLMVNRSRAYMLEILDLQNTGKVLASLAETNTASAHALITDPRLPDTHDGKRPWEKYHVLFPGSTGSNEHLAIIWPRDVRAHARAAAVTINGDVMIQSTNLIMAVIGKAQPHVTQGY